MDISGYKFDEARERIRLGFSFGHLSAQEASAKLYRLAALERHPTLVDNIDNAIDNIVGD